MNSPTARRPGVTVAELVPLTDRVRWMVTYRLVIVALLVALTAVRGVPLVVPLVAAVWTVLTLGTLPAARLGRRLAVTVFTLSLLGDGVMLAAARPFLGWLNGPVELLILGHVVAVTLLASFRTGAKITVWHVLMTLLSLETRAAGLVGEPVAVPLATLAQTVAGVCLVMITTAAFAAVNERELRRRRYDSDQLHRFGLAAAGTTSTPEATELLIHFARDELLAKRIVVLVHPGPPGEALNAPGTAYADAHPEAPAVVDLTGPAGERSLLRRAVTSGTTVLTTRLLHQADPVLDELLPAARGLIIVPFSVAEASGALILEHGYWSSQRASKRVEARMIATAEQAVAQASVAIGRAMLLEQVRAAAQTDGLTGLANRRTFDEWLNREVVLAVDAAGCVSLIMIDLDHFKSLNDRFGHQTGDDVLRRTAEVLREVSPPSALAARYGGEEMAVIAPGVDAKAAQELAERIRLGIAQAPTPAPVTASLGVATCPDVATTVKDLIRAADAALYDAKAGGRNQVRCAAPADQLAG